VPKSRNARRCIEKLRRVGGEDPSHDRRLVGLDLELAGDRRPVRMQPATNPIAETQAAAAAPRPYPTLQAATRLLRQILQEQRGHRALQADMQFRHVQTLMGRMLPAELHLVVDRVCRLRIAAEPCVDRGALTTAMHPGRDADLVEMSAVGGEPQLIKTSCNWGMRAAEAQIVLRSVQSRMSLADKSG